MKPTHLTPALKYSAGTPLLSPRWFSWRGVLSRLALFLGLAALLTLLAGVALIDPIAVSPHAPTASHACQTRQVTLHGNKPPTLRCLDGQKLTARTLTVGSGPLAHQITLGYCPDDALVIFWNANRYLPELCALGSGVLNLTDVYNGSVSWNDQASSFWTGCYNDFFYVNTNRDTSAGTAYASGSYDGEYSPSANFPYQNVLNDSLSSVWQASSEGGDEC